MLGIYFTSILFKMNARLVYISLMMEQNKTAFNIISFHSIITIMHISGKKTQLFTTKPVF